MSATEEPPAPTEKTGCMVRAFLMALPIGLAFMVPLSLLIYYQKKHQPPPATSEYAAMLRKDVDVQDFARYVRILSRDIGERSLANPENLDAASSFIESTIGYENMGYAVERQVLEAEGKPAVNLIAELTGKTKPNEVVLVVASYDEADALGISALMCVAHALAGTDHGRTVRFAAVMSQVGGLENVRNRMSAEGKKIRTLILVTPGPQLAPGASPPAVEVKHFPFTKSDDPNVSAARLRELQLVIERSADAV